jgi:phage baseplate assembly protein W
MAQPRTVLGRTVIPGNEQLRSAPVSRTYRGISTVANVKGNFSLYDINLIKQDLINHFHIRQGEKLENPEFGCIIWDLLFDPLTDGLKNLVARNVTDIVNYDPRVKVDKIIVSQYESGIQIECELTYLPYNIAEALRFRFDQNNNILS